MRRSKKQASNVESYARPTVNSIHQTESHKMSSTLSESGSVTVTSSLSYARRSLQ